MLPNSSALMIVCNQGIAFPLDRHLLLANLRVAARDTGTDNLWLLDDVATAVWTFLYRRSIEPPMRLENLEQKVRQALRHVGYAEIAGSFRLTHPVQRMSLLQCTRHPPLRNEMDFYSRLQSRILDFHSRGARLLYFTDLLGCEAELGPIHGLLPSSHSFPYRAKIVSFVRRQIRSLSWPHAVQCIIA